jgi:CRP-like cAMP-binding protein
MSDNQKETRGKKPYASPKTEIHERGAVLLRQGDAATDVLWLLEGMVSVTRRLTAGTDVPITLFRGGGLLGVSEALLGKPLACTYRAEDRVRLIRYTVEQFEAWLSDPEYLGRSLMYMKLQARSNLALTERVTEVMVNAGIPGPMIVTDTDVLRDEVDMALGAMSGTAPLSRGDRILTGTPVEGFPVVTDNTPTPELMPTPKIPHGMVPEDLGIGPDLTGPVIELQPNTPVAVPEAVSAVVFDERPVDVGTIVVEEDSSPSEPVQDNRTQPWTAEDRRK